VHQVGAGALGPVFRGYDPEGDRAVAIKSFPLDLTPEQVIALSVELERLAAAGLSHPSIVGRLAAGAQGDTAFLVEDYFVAESLDVALKEYGPAPIPDALRLIGQLAGALDLAAAAGVLHGALHPRDILVAPHEVRLTGLGIVPALEHVGFHPPPRLPYSAPVRAGAGQWGATADVFSLACVAFELLTGRKPTLGGEGVMVETDAIQGADAAALAEVFARALSPRPDDRHPGALAFAAGLRHGLTGEPLQAGADSERPRRARPAKPPAAGRTRARLPLDEAPTQAEPHEEPPAAPAAVEPALAAPASAELQHEVPPEPPAAMPPDLPLVVEPAAAPPPEPQPPARPDLLFATAAEAAAAMPPEPQTAAPPDLPLAAPPDVPRTVATSESRAAVARDTELTPAEPSLVQVPAPPVAAGPEPAAALSLEAPGAPSPTPERQEPPRAEERLAEPPSLPADLPPTAPPAPERDAGVPSSAPGHRGRGEPRRRVGTGDTPLPVFLEAYRAAASEGPAPAGTQPPAPQVGQTKPAPPPAVPAGAASPPARRASALPLEDLEINPADGGVLPFAVPPEPGVAPIPEAGHLASGEVPGLRDGALGRRVPTWIIAAILIVGGLAGFSGGYLVGSRGLFGLGPAQRGQTRASTGPAVARATPGAPAKPEAPAPRPETPPAPETVAAPAPAETPQAPAEAKAPEAASPGTARGRAASAGSAAPPAARTTRGTRTKQTRPGADAAAPTTGATPAAGSAAASASRSAGKFEGSIDIESRPAGAMVLFDGHPIGTTPVSLSKVTAGSHVVRLQLDGYSVWSRSVQVTTGQRTRITASLERQPGG
jgi:serine/threonine-protein kinase